MHNNNFDFLRFLFAFVVVLSHIVSLSAANTLSFLSPVFDTHLCVTGFFVISGFLISQSYARSKSLSSYFEKRARRLLPGYFFAVIFFAIGLAPLSSLGSAAYFSDKGFYQYLAANLFFLNFLHPCLPGAFQSNKFCAVNGALWTIKVEVAFYVLLPFIIYLIEKTRKKLLMLMGIYILSLAYNVLLQHLYSRTGNSAYITLGNQLPAFMTYFASGIALHHFLPVFLKNQRKCILAALLIFGVEYYAGTEWLRPLAWALIILYVAYNFRALNNFGKYGDFSYGIYIFHFPVIQIFTAMGAFKRYDPFLMSLTIIAIVLCVAVLSWNLIEKRFISRKQLLPKPAYSASTINE